MLMYSFYRNTMSYHDLIENRGRKHEGFQDIRILEYLCVRVTCHDEKVCFVDIQDVMEERLRAILS